MSFLEKILRHRPKPITENELRDALKHQEFVFYYQPEWDLKTNKTRGIEALVRWESPKRGYVPPMDFIPLLEKTDLIHDFTAYLFNHTLPDLVKIHTVAPDLFLAVNLSICQLQEKDLIQTIQNALQANNLDSKYLECELTESQELTDDILSNGVLDKLAELNIPVSIDDFGTGYSSLSYLHKFSVDKLKVDKSFVRDLENNRENSEIVKAIVSLGHALDLDVVAEGCENEKQLEMLKNLDCDAVQGFYFARPLSAEKAEEFIRQLNSR